MGSRVDLKGFILLLVELKLSYRFVSITEESNGKENPVSIKGALDVGSGHSGHLGLLLKPPESHPMSKGDPLKADLPQYCKECKFHEIPPDIKEVGVKHFWEKLQPNPLGSLKGGKNTGVGCHLLLQCMKVKIESEVTQSCPTLSPPGSSVHGIFQARVLECVAIAFSPKKVDESPKEPEKKKTRTKSWEM
ncbi:hypothetical protein MG293_002160 [Ovis ammon polii]|uniref:Uncharacterized protein n=1 Tax=Ovis ammon polii TaxID=230172 RepID=A0AAD4USA4_OVIAM|nr:hypothetical protein MG293_002160 [Ovis ammon polii]